MKKLFFTASLLALAGSVPAYANGSLSNVTQSGPNQTATVAQNGMSGPGAANSTVNQTGDNNTATVTQANDGSTPLTLLSGYENTSNVTQTGSHDTVTVDQINQTAPFYDLATVNQGGSNNSGEIIQRDDGQIATLVQAGADNQSIIHQGLNNGLDNSYSNHATTTQVGTNGYSLVEQQSIGNVATVAQSGNADNSEIHQLPGGGGDVATVVQSGNADTSLINQDGFTDVATVTQTGNSNASMVAQHGNNDTATVFQLTSGNTSNVTQNGNFNLATVTQ